MLHIVAGGKISIIPNAHLTRTYFSNIYGFWHDKHHIQEAKEADNATYSENGEIAETIGLCSSEDVRAGGQTDKQTTEQQSFQNTQPEQTE